MSLMEELDLVSWRAQGFPSVFVLELFLSSLRIAGEHMERTEDGEYQSHPGYRAEKCRECGCATIRARGAGGEAGCGGYKCTSKHRR